MTMTIEKKKHKKSYTISCSSEFRQKISDLAEEKGVNIADIARSVVIMLPKNTIQAYADPGDAEVGDRDSVTSINTDGTKKTWMRKPRIQVRLGDGYDSVMIRKALNIALHMAHGNMDVELLSKQQKTNIQNIQAEYLSLKEKLKLKHEQMDLEKEQAKNNTTNEVDSKDELKKAYSELDRLSMIVNILTFESIETGIKTKNQALHVMCLTPDIKHIFKDIKDRYRLLSRIHHPDSPYGSTEKMAILNDAFAYLKHTYK